jgi:protein TonB
MFDTVLAASQSRQGRRRWRVLPLAVLLHAGVLWGVVFAGYWSVEEVREPQFAAVFHVLLEPPAAAAAPPRGPEAEPGRPPEPQPPPDETPQPVLDPQAPIPDPPALPTEPGPTVVAAATGPAGGDPQGAEDGVPWGIPDGRGQGPGDVVGAVEGEGDVIRLHAGMTPPQILHRVAPVYTETARRARVEGIVILEAVIDSRGTIDQVVVRKPLGFGLDQRAVEAVRQWRFLPARLNGRPVAVYFTLTVRYDLT